MTDKELLASTNMSLYSVVFATSASPTVIYVIAENYTEAQEKALKRIRRIGYLAADKALITSMSWMCSAIQLVLEE